MTEHRHRGSRRLVVVRREHPPAEGAYTQRREIISGDVLRAQRSRERFDAFTPRTHTPAAGLESRHFFEFRRLLLQTLEQRIGKHPPLVLRPAFDAAIVAGTDSVEPAGISNRQGTQHHGVDQGEYGGSPADSQGQGKHRRNRKDWRQTELAQGVAHVAKQV